MRKQLWTHRALDLLTLALLCWLAVVVQRRHMLANSGDGMLGDGTEYGLSEQAHEAPAENEPGTQYGTTVLAIVLLFAGANALWSSSPDSTLGGLKRLGRGPRADNLFLAVRYRELRARGAEGAEAPEPGYLNAFDRRWAVVLLPRAVRWGTPLRAWTAPLRDGGVGQERGEPLRFTGRLLWSWRIERGSPWVIAHVRLDKAQDERRTDRFLAAFAPHQLAAES